MKSGTENIEVRMKDEGLPAGQSFVDMDFSLFKTITQRVSVLNNNPPAMRVETICYTKKSPIRYNIVVQATIVRKDGDFNG
mgnify:CR=1 FL=1